MGKLSRYILREHLGPFIFALGITLFVLIIDLLPNIIELIIGKNLDALTVIWVFILNLAWMLVLAVPMASLIASLMAFGRLSSDFEILAMKTSGVNVIRMILPVLTASLILGGVLFWFNNEILPDTNHQARILMGDLRVLRPTLTIRSNIFINDIPGYNILIGDVDHKTSKIKNVLIFDQRSSRTTRTVTADQGYLEFLDGGRVLSFELEDGEIFESGSTDEGRYKRVSFKKQVFNIRDVSRELRHTKSSHRGDREMSTGQMLSETNKLKENINTYLQEIQNIRLSFKDPAEVQTKDTITSAIPISTLKLGYVVDALTNIRNTQSVLKSNLRKVNQLNKSVNVYLLEVHKKFSLPAACVFFVLIGAPLGILARRGGMGTAIGISIGLFIIYWAFLIGGEELSDRGIASPALSMWAPNILLGVAGIILLYKVTSEKTIFGFLREIRNSRIGITVTDWIEKLGQFLQGESSKSAIKLQRQTGWMQKLRPLKIMDSYILKKFFKAFILSLFVFVVVTHLVELIQSLDTYIDKQAAIYDIFSYYVFYTPFLIILTTPVATLLGAIFTVGLMARHNELLAIKASGVSLWRIALPLLIVGFCISVTVFISADKLLPYTNQKKSNIRYAKIEKNPNYKEEYYSNLHRRGDQGRIFNFRLYNPKDFLGKEIEIHTYSENKLIDMLKAKELYWSDTVWIAVNGEKKVFSALEHPEDADSIIRFDTLYLSDLTETPERFARRKIDPRDFGYDQTISDLKAEIVNKERNGIDAAHEKVFLRFKYSLPFSSFIIILMAVPLAAHPKRGSPAIGFAIAIGISFSYMILFEVFRTLGTSGKLPPELAAWSVNGIFLIIGLFMMLKARK